MLPVHPEDYKAEEGEDLVSGLGTRFVVRLRNQRIEKMSEISAEMFQVISRIYFGKSAKQNITSLRNCMFLSEDAFFYCENAR